MIHRPTFAVVGHPNKGKSSIVSTLSQNDAIKVSSQSGTTTHSQSYRVELDTAGYELIDTPGFQRPRKVLSWLKSKATNAAQRKQAIAEFVADPKCKASFPDEVELLSPIAKGAAILYVVDGSRPFGAEYELEMEILRWTGQPSMALINPIENEKHIEEWRHALMQYFKTVHVFNPMSADFKKQMALLETFAFLEPNWSESLNAVIASLKQQKAIKKEQAVEILARLVEDLCSYQVSQKVLNKTQAESIKPVLEKQFEAWMVKREQDAVKQLFALYSHYHTEFELQSIELPPHLFDQKEWYAWGLNKKQLTYAATAAGVTAGAAIDLAVAGHSFLLGAIGGGIAGFSSAFFGSNKLTELKLKGIPMGGYKAVVGPVSNLNFPFAVLGRFIYIYRQVSQKNHADRSSLNFQAQAFQQLIDAMDGNQKSALMKSCSALVKQKPTDDLRPQLLQLLSADKHG